MKTWKAFLEKTKTIGVHRTKNYVDGEYVCIKCIEAWALHRIEIIEKELKKSSLNATSVNWYAGQLKILKEIAKGCEGK